MTVHVQNPAYSRLRFLLFIFAFGKYEIFFCIDNNNFLTWLFPQACGFGPSYPYIYGKHSAPMFKSSGGLSQRGGDQPFSS